MGNAELATGPAEPTPTPWSFGLSDRLAKALTVAHVSNAEMAQALDVSRNTITNYTSGRTKPSRLQLREWAVRTGAPLEWLETGAVPDPNMPPKDYKAAGSLVRVDFAAGRRVAS